MTDGKHGDGESANRVTATGGAEPNGSRSSLVGAVLGDRYEVLAPLGQGGMGVVVRAFDRELELFVAEGQRDAGGRTAHARAAVEAYDHAKRLNPIQEYKFRSRRERAASLAATADRRSPAAPS